MLREYKELGKKATRDGFGEGLLRAACNGKVVALCADLTGSLKMDAFANKYPDRFFQCGIAEANMMGTAAGLSLAGYIPFAGTFAAFATGRVYDQIRQSIAYSNLNVKIAASHAGLTLGEDGATHQILEDIGLMRMLPNMRVVVPADYTQTIQATMAAASLSGPVYLRFGRPSVPVFIQEELPFEIGKAQILTEGPDAAIIACGHLVWPALQAAKALGEEGLGVSVINMHTIKPLDETTIVEFAKRCGAIVTAEEHMRNGGLGEAVASVLSRTCPTPQEYVAVADCFGESGKPMELMAKYGLDVPSIVKATRRAIERKGK